MVNKCVELEYFLFTGKVIANTVILRLSKNDYALWVHYLCWAKQYKNVGWAPAKMHKQRSCFTQQHGTENALLSVSPCVLSYVIPMVKAQRTFKVVYGVYNRRDLWNLILDPLLREHKQFGKYVQAVANDMVLIFSGQSVISVEEEAQRALAHVHYCGGSKSS
ncbi:hypothetical protein EVAR_4693_1 [Eumeta japonica]|uniref:Uncharacterized protein n=1 Tax=Eumeta variegata TaxID=151549 RepID=A0A4C1WNH5_EUMVA|nr:hypothetical protein EVAR_4693_1 [Eumeta japonica]